MFSILFLLTFQKRLRLVELSVTLEHRSCFLGFAIAFGGACAPPW